MVLRATFQRGYKTATRLRASKENTKASRPKYNIFIHPTTSNTSQVVILSSKFVNNNCMRDNGQLMYIRMRYLLAAQACHRSMIRWA